VSAQEPTGDSPKGIKHKKRIRPQEVHFAKLIADLDMGAIEAARVALGWRCEPGSAENQKARNLARSARVKAKVKEFKDKKLAEEKMRESMRIEIGELHKGNLREYAFKMLEKLRDNPNSKAAVRFNAIRTLKKLHDPGKDVNLIWKWIDLAWRYQTAHCPACHRSFPLAAATNKALREWRKRNGADPVELHLPDRFCRQMELISRADKRRTPHAGQIRVLAAPERHVVGKGAARAGKSYLLAMIAAMGFCLPGVEIWILAETYDRSSKEVEYLQKFLNALFFPHYGSMVRVSHDKKSGDFVMTSRWGSEVRVKSSKSKGSITGHALEFALCAEPGWLPADIYEELRARMSERVGRIIALGTPKGVGGFIGRMTNMHGRDPKTGKMIRWKPADRLIENGCPWNISMLVTNLDPKDNPEYVQSELAAARMELTDEEYASEFEGVGIAAEGAKFGLVREGHLKMVEPPFFQRAVYLLGIDQGPVNFGACLMAFDGRSLVTCWEYFNSDDRTTMKRNLIRLRARVPRWIQALEGDPERWVMTITDQDPMLDQIFYEMEEEGMPWFTDITKRHRNMAQIQENWRRENQEFINNMAKSDRLFFHLLDLPITEDDESPGGYLLHDQVMHTIDVAEDPARESKSSQIKGWQVSDPFRGDHVLDAWYFATWLVCSQQISLPEMSAASLSDDPWASQKESFYKKFKRQEDQELHGYGKPVPREGETPAESWRRLLHGGEKGQNMFGPVGHYGDEA
jgi:hypothetical protein